MDENTSIRAFQLKQFRTDTNEDLAEFTDKEERSRKIDDYAARIASNHCIFEDTTVPDGILSFK